MIETVLKPIAPGQIRGCLTHEHLTVYGTNEASIAIREKALRTIVPQLRELRERHNCNTLIECTPTASTGRDLPTYAEVARRARFHVIACTGFYTVARSPWWMKDASVRDLVARWKREARHGMDGTDIRPGVLKATAGPEILDRRGRSGRLVLRWFEAVAQAHGETGLPIITHVGGDTSAAQLNALMRFGVRPDAVMLGHVDSRGSLEQLLWVVDQGAYLSFNCGGGHLDSRKGIRQAMGLAKALVDRGYGSRITLSADAAFWPHQSERLDPDSACPEGRTPKRTYRCVFTEMAPMLRKVGVSPKQIRDIFVGNPRRYLGGAG